MPRSRTTTERRARGRSTTGRRGERLALWFMRRRGYRLVARNFLCPVGELDLVMRRGTTLVIVEVRSVTQDYLASPLDSVTEPKRRRVRRAAAAFLALHRPRYGHLRFDLIGVRLNRSRWRRFEWRKNAFGWRRDVSF